MIDNGHSRTDERRGKDSQRMRTREGYSRPIGVEAGISWTPKVSESAIRAKINIRDIGTRSKGRLT